MKPVKNAQGFTLLELLMVVIIIGILASIALPQWQNFNERAQGTEALGILQAVKTAEELYRLETGSYVIVSEGSTIGSYYKLPLSTRFWNYTGTSGTIDGKLWKMQARHKVSNKYIQITVNNGTVTWEGDSPGRPNT
ncbi:MAG: prepilin-type N-terminal cleavage/methylation domain-containing protein [Candidatus Omnitrophica bacterium]|nr:prepilin-type N-terminal cleavage/methylation domain-containing protein [Candidatus Omnitrophota bacterium]